MRTPEETAALADRITVETPEGPAKITGHFHEDGAWAMADPVDGAPNMALAYCAAELAEARETLFALAAEVATLRPKAKAAEKRARLLRLGRGLTEEQVRVGLRGADLSILATCPAEGSEP